MVLNHVPKLSKDNPTGCCPRFNPKLWDGKTFVFNNKRFVRFTVRSLFYMPLNMGRMMSKILQTVNAEGAVDDVENIMLSHDLSPWQSEHFLAVKNSVPSLQNIMLSGKFLAKVFDGPYKNVPTWLTSMRAYVDSKKKIAKKIYLNYTMCPKCSKFYGHNYVVAMAQL